MEPKRKSDLREPGALKLRLQSKPHENLTNEIPAFAGNKYDKTQKAVVHFMV